MKMPMATSMSTGSQYEATAAMEIEPSDDMTVKSTARPLILFMVLLSTVCATPALMITILTMFAQNMLNTKLMPQRLSISESPRGPSMPRSNPRRERKP